MNEADPDKLEEIISYALGRANITTLKDVKHGTQARSHGARTYLARRILEHIKRCGYAIVRVRPPIAQHTTGPGFKPEPKAPPPSKPLKPD